jgi:DNA polymerase III psi subunit
LLGKQMTVPSDMKKTTIASWGLLFDFWLSVATQKVWKTRKWPHLHQQHAKVAVCWQARTCQGTET